MILIIDNKSRYIKELEKKFIRNGISYKVIRAGQRLDLGSFRGVKGVILSGGSLGIYNKSISNDFIILMNFKAPILGFCMGYEVIAVAFGGFVEKLPKKQYKMQKVIIDSKNDPIFRGLSNKVYLREKHVNEVSRLPKGFKKIAHSDVCKYEAIRHKSKKIYGFQSHPEVSGSDGDKIINNFLEMCGIKERLK